MFDILCYYFLLHRWGLMLAIPNSCSMFTTSNIELIQAFSRKCVQRGTIQDWCYRQKAFGNDII